MPYPNYRTGMPLKTLPFLASGNMDTGHQGTVYMIPCSRDEKRGGIIFNVLK